MEICPECGTREAIEDWNRDQEERTDKRTETRACDLISRQAAIDAYGDWYVEEGTAEGFIGTVKQLLEGLPPAQPKRKMGKWIQNDNGTYSCSLCHSWIPEEQYHYAQFCLYCGADMRGATT